MFMSAQQLADFTEATLDLGTFLQAARHLAQRKKKKNFQVTFKTHLCQHLPEQARLINPRYVTVYSEESLVYVVSKICRGSSSGKYKRLFSRTILLKYLVLLALSLEL